MKNTIFKVGLFNLGLTILGLNSTLTHAGIVDFSQCDTNSSFAIVTQSEGPTYACGGIDNGVGNPINVLNGNKFEAVEDFKELPAFKGLSFSRFYNSQSNTNTALGYGWYSSFDIKLYEQPDIIQIRLDSGQRINFKKNKIHLGNNQFVIRALPLNPADGWIEKKIDGSGWIWHKAKTNQDYFFQYLGGKDPNLAHISKITAQADIEKNSPNLNFNFYYDQQQRLSVVKNLKGDQLSFLYTTTKFGLPQVTLTTPIGRYYYFLDRNNNLAQVVYPDGRRFQYSYDPKFQGGDIHNLTAKWVFDQSQKKFKLISQWQYDRQDRAILSQHANGVEKVSIQFDTRTRKDMPANYTTNKAVFKNIVTNSLGQKTTYSYRIDGTQFQLLESLGAGCVSCGEVNKRYRFNPQGLVTYAADLDSSGKAIRTIELKYNDFGEITTRTVSGIGVEAQTTTYEYESYQIQQNTLAQVSSPFLSQLNQQYYRRLKTELRNSVVPGKHYRKQYVYNQNNQLISVQENGFSPLGDHLVRETKYGYDPQGRLAWEDGPLPNGKTNSPQDSDIRTYQYNASGQLQHLVLPGQQSVQVLSFDQLKRPEKVKIQDGQRAIQINLSYLGSELTVSKYVYLSDNTTHTIVHRYNDDGQLVSTKNGLQQTDFIYDLVGRLSETRNLNGLTHSKQYNTENLVTDETITDQDGKLVQRINNQFNLDAKDISVKVSDSLGLLQQTTQTGLMSTRKDALNRVFIQHVDGLGRSIALQTENSNRQLIHTTLSLYQQGHASQFSAGLQQNKWMDDFGRTVVTQSPAIGIKLFRFNEADLAIEIIDEKGLIQKNKYDHAYNLIESSVKNPQTQVEMIIQKTEFDGSKPIRQMSQDEVQHWRYAQDGKLLRHTTTQLDKTSHKKNIQPINFIHQTQQLNNIEDILSEKSKQQDHNLPINSWSEDYEYDKNGLLLKEKRRDLTIQYDRDHLGKITALQLTKNGKKSSVDQIQWSSTGQLTHYRLSTGQQLWRTYDSRGRLIQQRWYSPTSQSWWGRLIVNIKYRWLGQNLPESDIQTSNYVYDQANRLIYSNESGRQFYQYDDQDQLLAVWKSDQQHKLSSSWYPTQVYAYDAQGNRRLQWQKADKQQPEAINLYRYGENGDASIQLLGVSQHLVNKAHIQTGQLTRLAAYTQTGQPHAWWQAEPQVNTVLDYVPSANTGAPLWDTSSTSWHGVNDQNQNISIDQQFNQQGLISKRSVAFNTRNQQREFSQRNGYVNGIRIWEQQRLRMPNEQFSDIHAPEIQDVVVDRDYVMLAGLPVMQFSQISTQKQNEPFNTASASFNAVQFNRIGAPVKVYDENNTARWQTDYSPFGERLNTISTHDNEAKLIRIVDTLPISQSMDDLRYAISIRLPGQNEDPITGLYDNGYRQYDPTIGRYLTPDPMGTVDGLNPYLYVGNNPLNKVDPYGLYQTDMHYYMTYFLAITAGIDSDNARRIALATQFVDENRYTAPMIEGHSSPYFAKEIEFANNPNLDESKGAVWVFNKILFVHDMAETYIQNLSTNKLNWYHFVNNKGLLKGGYDLSKPQGMSDQQYQLWRLTSNVDKIPRLKKMTTYYKDAAKCNGNLNLSMQFFGEYLHAFEDTFAHRNQKNDPYGVNTGLGHAIGGTNPDHTYDNDPKGWKLNEQRTLISQEETYKKLVKYNQDILKNNRKAIPWDQIKGYLKTYNQIRLDHDDQGFTEGSLESLSTKIIYLENLLNGKSMAAIWDNNANKYINVTAPKWGLKTKDNKEFDLITKVNAKYIKGTHGYDVPLALSTRIDVLSKVQNKDSYKDVIWDTSIAYYRSHDNELPSVVDKARKYRYELQSSSAYASTHKPTQLKVTGTPPVAPLK